MATALAEKSCTPCRGGIPPLTAEEAEGLHAQAPEWALLDDAKRIERTYRFRNFREAFNFVERAAALAEEEAHHPEIRFGWGFATISLQTKKIKGLHENDFIMAAKLDRLALSKLLGRHPSALQEAGFLGLQGQRAISQIGRVGHVDIYHARQLDRAGRTKD